MGVERRPRWRRLTLLALTALLLVGFAPQASAGVFHPDCAASIVPSRPDSGITGFLDGAPAKPVPGDPFAPNASVSLYQAYHWSGLSVGVYHEPLNAIDRNLIGSCDYPLSSGIVNASWNTLLGFGFTLIEAALSLTGVVLGAALDPTWLASLNGVVISVIFGFTKVLGNGYSIIGMLFGLCFIAGAIAVAASRRAGDFAHSARALGKAAFIIVSVALTLSTPVLLANTLDAAVGSAVSTTNQAVSGLSGPAGSAPVPIADAIQGVIAIKIVYPLWTRAMLDQSDTATTRAYGPDLWKATHLTFTEQAEVDKGADQAKAVFSAKGKLLDDTAAKIRDADPTGYAALTGHNIGNRATVLLLLTGAVIAILPVLAFGAFLLLIAYLTIRMFVTVWPLIGPLAMLGQGGEKLALGFLHTALGALRNAVIFGSSLALFVTFAGGILTAPVPLWLALLLLFISTAAFLAVTKPLRVLVRGASRATRGLARGAFYYEVAKQGVKQAEEEVREEDRQAEAESASNPQAPPTVLPADMSANTPTVAAPAPAAVVPGRLAIAGTAVGGAAQGALPAGWWQRADMPPTMPDRTETGAYVQPAGAPPMPTAGPGSAGRQGTLPFETDPGGAPLYDASAPLTGTVLAPPEGGWDERTYADAPPYAVDPVYDARTGTCVHDGT